MPTLGQLESQLLEAQLVPGICRTAVGSFSAAQQRWCDAANATARVEQQRLLGEIRAIRGEVTAPTGSQIQELFQTNRAAFDIFRRLTSQPNVSSGRAFFQALREAREAREAAPAVPAPPPPVVRSPPAPPAAPPTPIPVAPAPAVISRRATVPFGIVIPPPAAVVPTTAAPSFLGSILSGVAGVGRAVAGQVIGAAVGAGTALLTQAVTRAIVSAPTTGVATPQVAPVRPTAPAPAVMLPVAELQASVARGVVGTSALLNRGNAVLRAISPTCASPRPSTLCLVGKRPAPRDPGLAIAGTIPSMLRQQARGQIAANEALCR